jgi:hypothetical protein
MKSPFDLPFLEEKSILLLLLMTFCVIVISICCMQESQAMNERIKVVKLDSDGEYYGSCDGLGQCLPHLLNSLKSMAFCTQYAMPGTFQHNEVAIWHNCTLMDMASNFSLPIHFGWKPLRSLYIY